MKLIYKTKKVVQLPVDLIDPSPYQARTVFDEAEISALAVSILQNGLLQPITVRRGEAGRYQLIAGERRLRACRLAKMEKISAIVESFDDRQMAALGLLENIQRAQLNPFEAARGIREVISLWGCTQSEAAKRLGISQPALANKLRLLMLTGEQESLCVAENLSERHARAVLRLPAPQRTSALQKMAQEKMSVREADRFVDGLLNPKPVPQKPLREAPVVRDVRLFFNTMEHAVRVMAENGIPATAYRVDGDDFVEYTVHIPTKIG